MKAQKRMHNCTVSLEPSLVHLIAVFACLKKGLSLPNITPVHLFIYLFNQHLVPHCISLSLIIVCSLFCSLIAIGNNRDSDQTVSNFASIIKVTAHSNNRNSKSTREVILGSVRL